MLMYPIVLDKNKQPKAILQNAFNVYVRDQLIKDNKGYEELEFKIPAKDIKRQSIESEDIVEVLGRHYIIRVIEDDKQNEFITNVLCDATWYDLNDPEPIKELSLYNVGPKIAMDALLEGTGWTTGTVDITVPRDFIINEIATRLKDLRKIPKLYGGELHFNTKEKTVDLLEKVGRETNILFAYEKNMEGIKRIIDTRDMVTRLYLYGAGGITIESVNNGVPYLENYEWYDKIGKDRAVKVLHHKDERFKNPNYMKQWMADKLKVLSKPIIGYSLKVSILNKEVPQMGDYVTTYDKDLNLSTRMRIVQRNINVLKLEDSEVHLDAPVKTLADQLSTENEDFTGSASVASAIETAMEDVSMFNLLLNSRAEDGFAYWINQGFTVDNTAGVTGSSAFMVEGAMGANKSIEQTVSVANRDAYTISAQVEVNNLVKGTNGKLGFEVEFEYEDGTTETQFISVG